MEILETGFARFFEKEVPADPLKAEYLIPTFIGELLAEGKMDVKVLCTNVVEAGDIESAWLKKLK